MLQFISKIPWLFSKPFHVEFVQRNNFNLVPARNLIKPNVIVFIPSTKLPAASCKSTENVFDPVSFNSLIDSTKTLTRNSFQIHDWLILFGKVHRWSCIVEQIAGLERIKMSNRKLPSIRATDNESCSTSQQNMGDNSHSDSPNISGNQSDYLAVRRSATRKIISYRRQFVYRHSTQIISVEPLAFMRMLNADEDKAFGNSWRESRLDGSDGDYCWWLHQ